MDDTVEHECCTNFSGCHYWPCFTSSSCHDIVYHLELGLKAAKLACRLAIERMESGEGIKLLGWDGTLRMVQAAMKLAIRLAHTTEFGVTTHNNKNKRNNNNNNNNNNKNSSNQNQNWRTASKNTMKRIPTDLFKQRKSASKSRGVVYRAPRGIFVPEIESKKFQELYWQMEKSLCIHFALEIVRDVAIVPPTVDDCKAVLHASHHIFRLDGVTPECLSFAEIACDIANESKELLKVRTDPFAKKNLDLVITRIHSMLVTLEETCRHLGESNKVMLEIANKVGERLEYFVVELNIKYLHLFFCLCIWIFFLGVHTTCIHFYTG